MTASPTQRVLAPELVTELISAALGVPATAPAPLDGGGFAAVWRARAGDRDVVIKVAPSPQVPLLEYEAGVIEAEAEYLRLAGPAAPVAELLYCGRRPELLDSEFLITSLLPGTVLPALPAGTDVTGVWREVGAAVARVHTIVGDRFGYTGARAHGQTWPEAFTEMMASLLRDGQVWGVRVPAERIRAAVIRNTDALALVQRPVLVHFDLWDGNVLATVDSAGVARLSGFVDGERYLFGDPLVEFISPCMRSQIEDEPEHPFRLGYAAALGTPLDLDDAARRRLALYRTYLFTLMLVEMPSRAMTGPEGEARLSWATEVLERQLTFLLSPPPASPASPADHGPGAMIGAE